MRRITRLSRWSVVALVTLSIVVPLGIVLSVGHSSPVVEAADGLRVPSHSVPAVTLSVIHDDIAFTPTTETLPAPPKITARAGILVDLDTGHILWQRNDHMALPPASTTKVMTALVTLANFAPDQEIKVTKSALNQGWDESKMGLRAGETLTVKELLTGMLLVSANDAATVLATDTVGYARFVAAMNAQEAALGLSDSHFATPVGLDTPGHRLSAYDEAVIAAVIVHHFPLFASIVRTRYAVLPGSALHQTYYLDNINELLGLYPPAVGIKPGYTGDAGYCLVSMAVRNNHHLISVLLNAPLDAHESRALLDWGFTADGLPSTLAPPKPQATPTAKATATH